MKEWLKKFMQGRYGQDNLNRALIVICLIFILISVFTGISFFSIISISLLVIYCFRMLSRNTAGRIRENNGYLILQRKITDRFSGYKKSFDERKTHCYYKCPSCHTRVRVPKNLGRIRITCPRCRLVFEKKT